MKKIKEFYQSKRGKAILFFGFYLIFFIFLVFYLQHLQKENDNIKEQNSNQQEIEKVYTIKDLYNHSFTYNFIINDNNKETRFVGSRETIDYGDFENQYFLSFMNVNQLIKRSKVLNKIDNDVTYEITNDTLNELLKTSKNDGVNKIRELDGKNGVSVILDLTSFMEKESYVITLNYMVGESDE